MTADKNIDGVSNITDKNWQDIKSRDLTLEEILDLESNKEVMSNIIHSVG